MPQWYLWQGEALTLQVRVQPRASRDEVAGVHGNEALKVRITAPPVKGRANKHLIKFLARIFAVPRSHITLLGSQNNRNKRFHIDSPNQLIPSLESKPLPPAMKNSPCDSIKMQ